MRRRVDYKGVQEFYQSQNRHITKLLKSVDEIRAEKKQEEGDNRLRCASPRPTFPDVRVLIRAIAAS